jgi:hypothetical protein
MHFKFSRITALFAFVFPLLLSAQTDSALYKLLQHLPNDTVLHFKTYDGSGQLIHPDILTLNDSGKISFFLTGTPYPDYHDSVENPCIYKSFDGLNFLEPDSGINPLVATPSYDHNDDPDIHYDTLTKQFIIYYLETMRPDSQNVVQLTGSPGKIWEKKTILHSDLKSEKKFILSPSFVEINAEKNALFYVVKPADSTQKYHVEYILSAKNNEFKKSKYKTLTLDIPEYFHPWHLDVQKHNGRYYMLLNGFWGNEPVWGEDNFNKYTLLLATSTDLKKWNISPVNIVDCYGIGDDECKYVYRSTSLISGNIMVIWYSYVTKENIWKIGMKKVMLMNP